MSNELLLIISVLFIYGSVICMFTLFDEIGLYAFTVIATIAANIEVLILIKAFGVEQTLGNVLFASTFLITDILSEIKGKEYAKKSVNIGIVTSIIFITLTQIWLQFVPSKGDWAVPSIKAIFSNTPRMMIVGIVVYAIAQQFDVWVYHKWWEFTNKLSDDKSKFLWVRNNASTLISQLINTVLFTWGAFFGTYDTDTLISIAVASYIIFIVTSILDTPFVYLARIINRKIRS